MRPIGPIRPMSIQETRIGATGKGDEKKEAAPGERQSPARTKQRPRKLLAFAGVLGAVFDRGNYPPPQNQSITHSGGLRSGRGEEGKTGQKLKKKRLPRSEATSLVVVPFLTGYYS